MTDTTADAGATAETEKPKRPPRMLRALKALRDRKMLAMLLLALAAGLPYGAVLGTLNAWLTEAGVTPSTIGVLSFIILAYSYKFIWAPAFQRAWFPRIGIPGLSRLGPRRAWLLTMQVIIAALLGLLAMSQPATTIGYVALIGVMVAIASATHDIVLDAWRIEAAKSEEETDLMSALYQFGYRLATLLTGAVALVLAQRIGWPITYGLIALTMLLATAGTFIAPEPNHAARAGDAGEGRPTYAAKLGLKTRRRAVGLVALGWGIAIAIIIWFVASSLTQSPPPSANVFGREQGPLIVVLSVVLPAIVAAWLLRRSPTPGPRVEQAGETRIDRISGVLFHVILDPLMDLVQRLRWGVILVLALVLSYRFVDLVWGAFAYPFYMGTEHGALGHTNDDVAIASKTIGVLMIIIGSAVGAAALLFIGRMACLVIGAFAAALTNLLFADLATGGAGMDAFLAFTGLGGPLQGFAAFIASVFGYPFDPEHSERLARLIAAIAGENIAVGFASVAIMAYMTSIVNPRFAAVQYALLASLTMMIGSLGRAPLGAMIETDGFHDVFVLTAWLGMIAVALSAAEWLRQASVKKKPLVEPAAAPAPAE